MNWQFLLDKYGKQDAEDLIKYFAQYLEDFGGIIVDIPNALDDNAQIVVKNNNYLMFLAGRPFLKSQDFQSIFWETILLHSVFMIDFPETFKHTAMFLLHFSNNDKLISSKQSFSARISKKLIDDGFHFGKNAKNTKHNN